MPLVSKIVALSVPPVYFAVVPVTRKTRERLARNSLSPTRLFRWQAASMLGIAVLLQQEEKTTQMRALGT